MDDALAVHEFECIDQLRGEPARTAHPTRAEPPDLIEERSAGGELDDEVQVIGILEREVQLDKGGVRLQRDERRLLRHDLLHSMPLFQDLRNDEALDGVALPR